MRAGQDRRNSSQPCVRIGGWAGEHAFGVPHTYLTSKTKEDTTRFNFNINRCVKFSNSVPWVKQTMVNKLSGNISSRPRRHKSTAYILQTESETERHRVLSRIRNMFLGLRGRVDISWILCNLPSIQKERGQVKTPSVFRKHVSFLKKRGYHKIQLQH